MRFIYRLAASQRKAQLSHFSSLLIKPRLRIDRRALTGSGRLLALADHNKGSPCRCSPLWPTTAEPRRMVAIEWIRVSQQDLPDQAVPRCPYQRTLIPSDPCTDDFTLASPPMFHKVPISP